MDQRKFMYQRLYLQAIKLAQLLQDRAFNDDSYKNEKALYDAQNRVERRYNKYIAC